MRGKGPMAMNNTHSTAARPTTAAAIARIKSSLLAGAPAAAGLAALAAGIGAAGLAIAGPDLASVAVEVNRLAPADGGAGGAGTADRTGAGDAGPAGVAVTTGGAGGAPAAGKVGSLIVAVAEGFGGKLMRTVSFLGCTLAASPGFGGTGALGMLSDIAKLSGREPSFALHECQWLYPQTTLFASARTAKSVFTLSGQ